MKNPEKYECGSLRVKISECGRFYTPAREISGISSLVRENSAQNGSVGRYGGKGVLCGHDDHDGYIYNFIQ